MWYSSSETEESRREPDLISKVGGELQGCCAWLLRDAQVASSRCRSQVPRTICKAVSGELHLEGVAEPFCRRSDTCGGLREEILEAPIFPIRKKQLAFLLFLTAISALLKLKCHPIVLDRLSSVFRLLFIAFQAFLKSFYQFCSRI